MAHTISGASLAPIYQRLNSAPSYHPIEAETFADWSVEAGDIVTITRDGQSYESPVQATVVKWKKGQQVSVSSGGNEKRDSITKVSQNKYAHGSGGAGLRNSQYQIYRLESAYNELAAGLIITASGLYSYASNAYTGMVSGLTQTASSISAYVESSYTQMAAGLEITSSSLAGYVRDSYRQMESGLKLTSSSLHAYVRSSYEQMESGLALTASSAMIYTNGRTSRAYIMTRINATGESEATIHADVIDIDGLVLSLATKNIVANSLKAGSIQVSSSSGQTYVDVATVPYVDGCVWDMQVVSAGTNSYKIQVKQLSSSGGSANWVDVPGTFSRATAISGSWSGRTFNVVADPNGSSPPILTRVYDDIVKSGSATHTTSGNNHYATQTLVIYAEDPDDASSAGSEIMRKSVSILANSVYTSGRNVGHNEGGRTAFVSGSNSITGNGTYTYKGMYEDSNGDDQESGHNLTVTVAVPTSATPTANNVNIRGSTWDTGGKYQAGSVSKSSIIERGYISFEVHAGGTTRTYYIVVNT